MRTPIFLLSLVVIALMGEECAWADALWEKWFPGMNGSPQGIVTAKLGPSKDTAYGVAVQDDGKVLVVGESYNGVDTDFALMRLLPNGSPDLAFGDQGTVLFDSRLGNDKGYAVTVLSDGKILAAGSAYNGTNSDFLVLRFTPDGKLDKTFGKNGFSTIDFNQGSDIAYSLAVTKSGKVLIAGTSNNGSDQDFALARLTATGAPDVGFGELGKVFAALGSQDGSGGNEYAYSVLSQPDDKIVISGYSETKTDSVFVTIRYDERGRLDTDFGKGGMVITKMGEGRDRAYSSLLQPDGKIIVGGTSYRTNDSDFVMVRYEADGKRDMTFGDKGIVKQSFRARSQNQIFSVNMTTEGKILAAGSSFNGKTTDFMIAKFLPNGSVDNKFGKNGVSTLSGYFQYGAIYGVVSMPNGKVIAAGTSGHDEDYRIAILQYRPNGVMDVAFGSKGSSIKVAKLRRSRTAITAEVGLPAFKYLMEQEPRD